MRRTRFMTAVFLVLSAAFLAVPQFRQAFSLPVFYGLLESGRMPAWSRISEETYASWARQGEAKHDAAPLAYVALHTHDMKQAAKLADEATAINPKLSWIYFTLISNNGHRGDAQTLAWAKKLQAFEPDNALGYLQEGEYIRESTPAMKKATQDELVGQTAWRAAMAKAFVAPRYDSYAIERFRFEKKFLDDRGLATPVRLLFSMASYPIANLLNIRQYASLMVEGVGRDAEKGGKTKEALDAYWNVAHFGERMQLGGDTLIEQLIATAVQRIAYTPLASLLRSSGQADAATTVEFALASVNRRVAQMRGDDPLTVSANAAWDALLVNVLLLWVIVFSALTVLVLGYVILRRTFWPGREGRIFKMLMVAENYLPILLFFSCTGLYVTYYPYARNFQSYVAATGNMHDLESVMYHTVSIGEIIPGQQLSIGNPFFPYLWYAIAGLVIVTIVYGTMSRGGKTEKPKAAAGAGR